MEPVKPGMVCRVFDYPTRFFVSSESKTGDEYGVDLTAFPVILNGRKEFNGSCTCPRFQIGDGRKPSLKRQIIDSGHSVIRRCKHLTEARNKAMDICLEHLALHDPNVSEESMT